MRDSVEVAGHEAQPVISKIISPLLFTCKTIAECSLTVNHIRQCVKGKDKSVWGQAANVHLVHNRLSIFSGYT